MRIGISILVLNSYIDRGGLFMLFFVTHSVRSLEQLLRPARHVRSAAAVLVCLSVCLYVCIAHMCTRTYLSTHAHTYVCTCCCLEQACVILLRYTLRYVLECRSSLLSIRVCLEVLEWCGVLCQHIVLKYLQRQTFGLVSDFFIGYTSTYQRSCIITMVPLKAMSIIFSCKKLADVRLEPLYA